MRDAKYIGIDFGTTNCCVSYTQFHPKSQKMITPQVIEVNGIPILHNILAFDTQKKKLLAIGDDVYEHQVYLQHPEYLAREYKLNLDDRNAQQHASMMFDVLHRSITSSLNVKQLDPELHQVVIGVPAHWSETEVGRVLTVASNGGFRDASPVPEPLGAMLYHTYTGDVSFNSSPEFDLVLDYGGGTADFVVLQMAEYWVTPKIVYVYGDQHGGRDFDQALKGYMRHNYWRGQNWSSRLDVQLELYARRFKERFSNAMARGAPTYEQMCGLPRFETTVRLSREVFESDQVAGKLIEHFSTLIAKGLRESGLSPSSFRRVILSGGSSRWYFVENKLREYFKEAEIIRSALPEQAISKGLSLYMADPQRIFAEDKKAQFVSTDNQATSPYQTLKGYTETAQHSVPEKHRPAAPAVIQPSRLKNVAGWGFLSLVVASIADMFVGTPMLPDLTCICPVPIWVVALIVAYVMDRKEKKNNHA
jgi:molecular chaperone DnaK